MANLIPFGSETSAWYDVTVAAGSPKALYIRTDTGTTGQQIPGNANFEISTKSGSDYTIFDVLNSRNIACKGVIAAPGTFGVRRIGSSNSAAMDVEG